MHTIPIKAKDVPVGMDIVYDGDGYFFKIRHKCLEHTKEGVIFQCYHPDGKDIGFQPKVLVKPDKEVYWNDEEVPEGIDVKKLKKLANDIIKNEWKPYFKEGE